MGISPDRLAEIKRAAQERLTAAGHQDNKITVSNGVIETIKSHEELILQPIVTQEAIVASTETAKILPTAFTAFDLISNRISELQTALSSASPGYENHLIIIHKALQKDEECVHLLTEEQIGVIVAGLSKKKNIVINEAIVKKTRSSKSASKLTVEDL